MGLLRPITDSLHKVELCFEDGGLCARLICPNDGRDCDETITTHECWIKTWFDNCGPEELLHGKVTAVVDCKWVDGERLEARLS